MGHESADSVYSHSGSLRSFANARRTAGLLAGATPMSERSCEQLVRSMTTPIGGFIRIDRIGYDMYYGGNGRYLYQPIPKNACTKIKSLLLQIEGLPVDTEWWHVHQKEYNGFPGTHKLALDEQIDVYAGRTDTFKFVFIRNPYAKMASAYLDKIRKNVAPHIVHKIRTCAAQ